MRSNRATTRRHLITTRLPLLSAYAGALGFLMQLKAGHAGLVCRADMCGDDNEESKRLYR
jgi:hypothetical protein